MHNSTLHDSDPPIHRPTHKLGRPPPPIRLRKVPHPNIILSLQTTDPSPRLSRGS